MRYSSFCEWNPPARIWSGQDKQVYIPAPAKPLAATHVSLHWSGQWAHFSHHHAPGSNFSQKCNVKYVFHHFWPFTLWFHIPLCVGLCENGRYCLFPNLGWKSGEFFQLSMSQFGWPYYCYWHMDQQSSIAKCIAFATASLGGRS